MRFDSKILYRNAFPTDFSKEEISNEPMFYRASREFAYENGGPIMKAYLENLPDDWKDGLITVDSRSHMLMKGWYPAIPGFHHDTVIRSREDGQPNYLDTSHSPLHLMGLVNGDICPTEFALGTIHLTIPDLGHTIYKEWHPQVEAAIQAGTLGSHSCSSGRYIEFDSHAFHQAVPARSSGWRWFVRLTKNSPRCEENKNEIRKQVQVYLEHPMEGW